MIVAANDVGDAHIVVVDHHCEHVGRRAVGTQQYVIVELGVFDRNLALDCVLDCRFAVFGSPEPDDERRA